MSFSIEIEAEMKAAVRRPEKREIAAIAVCCTVTNAIDWTSTPCGGASEASVC